MRRIPAVAISAALLLVASFPGVAGAAPPEQVHDAQTDVFCEALTSDAGTAFVAVGVSETFGSFADLAFWAPSAGPETNPPTWITSFGEASLSADGTQLTASFELVELIEPPDESEPPVGDPVGTAALTATLSPIGDPESFSFSGRDGNRRFSVEGTSQQLAVSGRLELPGGVVFDDLSGCFASHQVTDTWSTSPNAFVASFGDRSISCEWMTESATVGLWAQALPGGAFAELSVTDASGSLIGFTEAAVLTTREFSATWDLLAWDMASEAAEVVGSAQASAELTRGERINEMHRDGDFRIKISGSQLLVDGSLALETPAGSLVLPMDQSTCSAQDVRFQQIITNPNGGRGPRLPNDTPAGALLLAPGETVEVRRTGGAALEPEAPCTIDDPEFGQSEVPIGRTVWYTVTGTGGELTVDTAGSDFDTVLGVYTGDGGTFTQVACVDDVFGEEFFSLQAAVTFATEAGLTYYVQAGGFAGEAGTLQLSVY